jgi:phage host-nuclease inhibitor protein Gam
MGRRERDKERKRVQNQVERLEKQLADLEREEKDLQAVVMKGGIAAAELEKGYARLGDLAQRIAAVMQEWEAASEQLQVLGQE